MLLIPLIFATLLLPEEPPIRQYTVVYDDYLCDSCQIELQMDSSHCGNFYDTTRWYNNTYNSVDDSLFATNLPATLYLNLTLKTGKNYRFKVRVSEDYPIYIYIGRNDSHRKLRVPYKYFRIEKKRYLQITFLKKRHWSI
jgi:hypothetical protein